MARRKNDAHKWEKIEDWKKERDFEITYKPKTPGQQAYWDALVSKKIIICDGPAGTGKTLLACVAAAQALKKKQVDKIIICRPLVVCDEEMGFMPGDMGEKTSPYLKHIITFFSELLPGHEVVDFVKGGVIEFYPLAFMRGSTHHRSFVIMDEAQNATMKQIKLFLTRIGDNSIFLLNGDSEQTDIHNSGFDEMFERLDVQSDNIQAVEMGINDIMRSPLVKELYRHFDKRLPPVTYKDAYKK